jgi:hypothetical protein
MKDFIYPDWVTDADKKKWDKFPAIELIEVDSLATPGQTFEALIRRPDEIATMEASEKMSSFTGGNNIAASNAILARLCSLKSPQLAEECQYGEYNTAHDIAIGMLIKQVFPTSQARVKKSLKTT